MLDILSSDLSLVSGLNPFDTGESCQYKLELTTLPPPSKIEKKILIHKYIATFNLTCSPKTLIYFSVGEYMAFFPVSTQIHIWLSQSESRFSLWWYSINKTYFREYTFLLQFYDRHSSTLVFHLTERYLWAAENQVNTWL